MTAAPGWEDWDDTDAEDDPGVPAAFGCSSGDIDESAGMAELEPQAAGCTCSGYILDGRVVLDQTRCPIHSHHQAAAATAPSLPALKEKVD